MTHWKRKRMIAAMMAMTLALGTAACGDKKETNSNSTPDSNHADENSTNSGSENENSDSSAGAASSSVGEAITPEELGSSDVKWSEEETSDGFIKVTNDGGKTLGYTKNSGISLIQVDGYAFKDLDKDGELDVYEDWRQENEIRAADLAAHLSGEEIAPLLTHGGWMSFGSELGEDEEYLKNGGRAGVTRSAYNEGNTEQAVKWVNMLQEYAETNGGYGIPITISTDPMNISDIIDQNALASTMNTELANEIAQEVAKEYRAVGVTMTLGPQIDIATQASWDRMSGSYSEDPALNRDLANAYMSGLQSTYSEDGTDEGWGKDSITVIAKHYVGAGASEGGRNDHMKAGMYTVFPGNNFEAHLVPFFDGAFNLDSSTGAAAGVMPNYAISYSEDGSLGELVGGAYSEYKMNMLRDNGYDGFVLTDWQITNDDATNHGVEDLTEVERFAALFKNGTDQVGGTTNTAAASEAYASMVTELGEEEALAIMRDHARRFFLTQIQVGLYENPYLITEESVQAVWTDDTKAFGSQTQEKAVIMLKNSDNTIQEADHSQKKATVYIPYIFTAESKGIFGTTPASWKPAVDLELAEQYYNVITDTLKDPSGEDSEGNAAYTEDDIKRAGKADLASCDYAIVSMTNPFTDGGTDASGEKYLPASLQYGEYTASTAHKAIANGTRTVEKSDGYYGSVKETVEEDRSYTNNSVGQAANYGHLETLQYVADTVSDECKIIVIMSMSSTGCMVWSEVEPLADAILMYYAGTAFDGSFFKEDVLLQVTSGQIEPTALLPMQQPADMEAVEAQQEDVPRDMDCYVDTDGNTYDFAYGLNWSGIINDDRVSTYSAQPLTKPENYNLSANK